MGLKYSWMICAFSVLGLAIGCSEDDEGGSGGGGSTTGLDASENLSDLTAQEICEANVNIAVSITNDLNAADLCYFSARLQGLFAPDNFESACTTAYDTCVDALPPTDTTNTGDPSALCADATQELTGICDATVGELEACITETVAAITAITDLECTEPVEDDDDDEDDDEEAESACDALDDACAAWGTSFSSAGGLSSL